MIRPKADTSEEGVAIAAPNDAGVKKTESKIKMITIFFVGFILGLFTIVAFIHREFDSTTSLRPEVLKQVDPDPIVVIKQVEVPNPIPAKPLGAPGNSSITAPSVILKNVTVVRNHIQATNFVNTKLKNSTSTKLIPKTWTWGGNKTTSSLNGRFGNSTVVKPKVVNPVITTSKNSSALKSTESAAASKTTVGKLAASSQPKDLKAGKDASEKRKLRRHLATA